MNQVMMKYSFKNLIKNLMIVCLGAYLNACSLLLDEPQAYPSLEDTMSQPKDQGLGPYDFLLQNQMLPTLDMLNQIIEQNDLGVEAGAEAGIEAGAEAGIEAGAEAGIEAGAEAGAEAGVEAGVEMGIGMETDPVETDMGGMSN